MIGGSSIEYQSYPIQQYPNYAPQPRANQNNLVRSTQTPPSMDRVRMQAAEEQAPRRTLPPLAVPSADQFGLGAKNRVAEVDWSNVRRRLATLSVASFHVQKAPSGFRCTIVVPSGNGERRKIECEAETDADAI